MKTKNTHAEMTNGENIICRLCCKTIIDDSETPIDELKIEMLEVVLIKLGSNTRQRSVICMECMDKAEDSFNFKSVCLYTEDFITPFLENNDIVDLKELYRRKIMKEKDELGETQSICRLCMNVADKHDLIEINENKENISFRLMLEKCIPELNMRATTEVCACKRCLNLLERYYNFLTSFLEIEEKIRKCMASKKFKGKTNTKLEMVLKCMAKEINKYSDDNGIGRLGNSSGVKVEQDEMEFEEGIGRLSGDELLCQQDNLAEESYACTTCDFSTKVKSILDDHSRLHIGERKKHACHQCTYESDIIRDLKRHLLTHKTSAEAMLYQCFQCPYKTKYKTTLSSHIASHDPSNLRYKCDECDYKTIKKSAYDRHKMRHATAFMKLPKKFRCANCDYETDLKPKLLAHVFSHMDSDLAKPLQCPNCPFRTTQKSKLKIHMVCHLKVEEADLYGCDQCDFKTKHKRSLDSHKARHGEANLECFHCQAKFKTKNCLTRHLKTHRPRKERAVYECQLCTYTSINKTLLNRHMDHHKRPDEVETFKCSLCTFVTMRKPKLKIHEHTHMGKGQVTMHKCPECDYETKWRYNLKHHLLKHRNNLETTMHKCTMCNYQTKYKGYLKYHILNHEGSLPVFECDKCDYKTTVKNNLNQHINRKHKDEETARIFRCDQCEFQTRDKGNLTAHRLKHEPLGNTYQCNDCPYKTKDKRSLYRHVAMHKTDKKYTCDYCGMTTKYGCNFRRHLEMCMEGRFKTDGGA